MKQKLFVSELWSVRTLNGQRFSFHPHSFRRCAVEIFPRRPAGTQRSVIHRPQGGEIGHCRQNGLWQVEYCAGKVEMYYSPQAQLLEVFLSISMLIAGAHSLRADSARHNNACGTGHLHAVFTRSKVSKVFL